MSPTPHLERIGFSGSPLPSLAVLSELHLRHLLTVPFENLDIHLGRPIRLDLAALYDKIVVRRRGGFCYELNGLFAALLRQLGFQVKLLSAEVARAGDGFNPPFDHLALLVELDEPWLADVGFGENFRYPLRLDTEAPQADPAYRLVREGPYRVLQRDGQPQYRFTLEPHQLAEFEAMCRFHQTSPESHLTRNRLCSLATPEGRLTLSGGVFIETTAHGRTESPVSGEEEFRSLLARRFNVLL